MHKYQNLLNREFNAERANSKWVTDIFYIQTKEGVLYLSMIRDLYDRSIVAYKTGTEQTVNLVLDTIKQAVKKEKVTGELQLHSDQGLQYTSKAYNKLTQGYGITPSMSRRGNCYECEAYPCGTMRWQKISFPSSRQNVFTETSQAHSRKQKKRIDDFIHFYNHERIQVKTGC